MKHKSVDLLLVVGITLVAVVAFIVPSGNIPGHILMMVLVLVLPGYASISAIVAKQTLGVSETLVFSLGLSLVITILVGLILHLTPFGLQSDSWIVLLCGITFAASAIAFIRRRGQTAPAIRRLSMGSIGLSLRQVLLLTLALVVLSGAVVISIVGAIRQPFPGFTQLWILPAGGTSPKNAVRLGINNMESTPTDYRLDVSVNGKVVKSWPSISLGLQEKWETTLVLPQVKPANSVEVEALLYRIDASTKLYRHVVLWLSTTALLPSGGFRNVPLI